MALSSRERLKLNLILKCPKQLGKLRRLCDERQVGILFSCYFKVYASDSIVKARTRNLPHVLCHFFGMRLADFLLSHLLGYEACRFLVLSPFLV